MVTSIIFALISVFVIRLNSGYYLFARTKAARKLNIITIITTIVIILAIKYAFTILDILSDRSSADEIWEFEVVSNGLILVAAAALTLGLFGEYSDSELWKESVAYTTAKVLVIAGVIVELIANAGIFTASITLHNADKKEVAHALEGAQKAYDGAVFIYKQVAWRGLNKKQKAAFRRLSDKNIKVGIQSLNFIKDAEANNFCKLIARELIENGVALLFSTPEFCIGGIDHSFGVCINRDVEHDLQAKELAKSFSDAEIPLRTCTGDAISTAPVIVVGSREPLPPLDQQ